MSKYGCNLTMSVAQAVDQGIRLLKLAVIPGSGQGERQLLLLVPTYYQANLRKHFARWGSSPLCPSRRRVHTRPLLSPCPASISLAHSQVLVHNATTMSWQCHCVTLCILP